MKINKLLQLGDVLSHVDDYPDDFALFLPLGEKPWNERTRAMVLDNDEDGSRSEAKEHGLEYALGVYAVQDIAANAREQDPNANAATLLKAFLFYYKHDAFIDLNSPGQ